MPEKSHSADIDSKINALKEEIRQRFITEVSRLRSNLFARMSTSSRDVTTNEACYRSTAVDDSNAFGDPETLADRELQGRQAKAKEIDTAKRTADSTVVLLQQELDILERIMLNAMEQSLFEGSLRSLLVGLNDSKQEKAAERSDDEKKVAQLKPCAGVLPQMDFNANLGAPVSDIRAALKKRIAPGS
jgi:hypothetical protein